MPFHTLLARLCLGLCLAFSLAACDSAASDDGAGGDPGDNPGTTLGDGTVTVTGDIETSIDGGAIFYLFQDGGFGITIADTDFSMLESDDDLPPEYLVVQAAESALAPATYEIGDAFGIYADYINEDGINGSDDDDANSVSGTLTITEVDGDRIAGTISAALVHESDEPNAQLEASFEAVRLGSE